MRDLGERFESLSRTPAPDLWSEIEIRDPTRMPTEQRGRRLLAASVALLVAAAGIGLAAITFRSDPSAERRRLATVLAPRANGRIAVARGPDADIILLDQEGGASTVLVERHLDGHEGGLQMAWSPDGSRLAYTDYRDDDMIGLFVLDLASGEVTDVSGGLVGADQPAWSPDGTEVAFTGVDAETGYEIYVAGFDGSALRRVTDEPDDGVSGAHMPTWSPEGTRIAFAFALYDAAAETESSGIAVVELEGMKETVIAESPDIVESPAWSPNGTKIAFLLKADDVTQVHIEDADGSGDHIVVAERTDLGAQPSAPNWSPDGSRLVFGSVDTRTSSLGITVVNADGTDIRTLLEDAYLATPIWSPAGDLIAFLRDDAGRPQPAVSLWLMRPNGSDQVELADDLEQVSEIAWQPVVTSEPTPPPTSVPEGSIHANGSALPEGRLLVQIDERRVEVLEEGAQWSTVIGLDLFALDLSRDGSRVLVSTPWDSVGPGSALVSLDLTTGERTTIAELDAWSLPARWSPDGAMVAYRLGEQNTLCIRDLETAEPRCLPELGRVYEFDWSPDGTQLVLDQPPPGSLTLVDVATEQVTVVARWDDGTVLDAVAEVGLGEPVAIQFQGPRWSPSGEYIAALAMVRTDQGHSGNVVLAFDLNGAVVALGEPFGEFSTARAWSPAADVFAYASGEPPYRIVEARLLDAKTSEDRLLIPAEGDRTIQSLVWSPSGRWVAAVLVAPDQGWFVSEIQIFDTTGVDPPRTFRSEGLAEVVDWGP